MTGPEAEAETAAGPPLVSVVILTLREAEWLPATLERAAAVLIGLLILWSAGKVLRESTAILLERSPIDPTDLQEDLIAIDGVERGRRYPRLAGVQPASCRGRYVSRLSDDDRGARSHPIPYS